MQYFSFDLINAYSGDQVMYTQQAAIGDKVAQTLNLEVKNTSDSAIEFVPLNDTPSKKHHHFELFFRQDILSSYSIANAAAKPGSGFRMSKADKGLFGGTYSFYIIIDQQTWEAGANGILSLPIEGLLAKDRKASGLTSVDLKGRNLLSQEKPIKSAELKEKSPISIQNNLINRLLPLQFSFRDHNTILNENSATNTLTLSVVNLATAQDASLKSAGDIVFSKNSRIKIGLEAQTASTSRSWALATEAELRACSITFPTGWTQQDMEPTLDSQGQLIWTFAPQQDIKMNSLDEFIITISNLKTSLAAGYSDLSFYYSDVVNYGNGKFLVPILKTPLITRGEKVGIGVENPGYNLDVGGRGDAHTEMRVNGRIISEGGAGGLWVDSEASKFVGADGADKIGLWADNWRLTASKSGEVNVPGTFSVNGETRLANKLSVDKDAVVSGSLSVNNVSSPISFSKEGQVYKDNWIGVMPIPNNGPDWLHIGGVTGADNQRRITLQGSIINTPGKIGIGTQGNPNMQLTIAGRGTGIQLGAEIPGKDGSAGIIGYKVWTEALDIVGAGEDGKNNRKIQMWAEGGTNFTGPITFNGAPLMMYTGLKGLGNPSTTDTGIDFNTYIAFPVGFIARGYDLREYKGDYDYYCVQGLDSLDNKWVLKLHWYADKPGTWEVNILALHRSLLKGLTI